jgi:hypothetical protein
LPAPRIGADLRRSCPTRRAPMAQTAAVCCQLVAVRQQWPSTGAHSAGRRRRQGALTGRRRRLRLSPSPARVRPTSNPPAPWWDATLLGGV